MAEERESLRPREFCLGLPPTVYLVPVFRHNNLLRNQVFWNVKDRDQSFSPCIYQRLKDDDSWLLNTTVAEPAEYYCVKL